MPYNHIIVEDNSRTILAVLQKYNFTKQGDNNSQFYYKLYKTKEGSWYYVEEAKIDIEKGILRMLKSAIDAKKLHWIKVIML